MTQLFHYRLHHLLECLRLVNGKFAQCLPVEEHLLLFRSAYEAAIHNTLTAKSGIQTGDPEAAELALLPLAIAIGIRARLHGGLHANLHGIPAPATEPLRQFEELGVSMPGADASLHTHLC